jgi:hypothetical protein
MVGDISDVSDMHFDTIGTEIKILLTYLQKTVNKKY